MSPEQYNVIFDGTTKEGEELTQVKRRLAALFRSDAARIEALFTSAPIAIKRNLNQQDALKYKHALEQAGARCQIEREGPEAATPKPQPPNSRPQEVVLRANTMLYQGYITYLKAGMYTYIVWPFVQVKKVLDAVFDAILGMIWSELMGHQQTFSQAVQLVAFLIFSILSLASFHLQNYVQEFVLWGFVGIWLLDRFFAQHAYFQTEQQEKVFLRTRDAGQLVWKKVDYDGTTYDVDIQKDEPVRISLDREERFAGAFEESIGTVWRLYLTLKDDVELLIDEQKEVMQAIKRAKKLGTTLHLPVIFRNSEGENPLAAGRSTVTKAIIEMKQKFFSRGTIEYQEGPETVRISSAWNRGSLVYFVREVLKESGFLLFLLIMQGVMIRYGMLVNWLIGPYLGLQGGTLYLDLSFWGVWRVFMPEGDLIDIIEIVVIGGIMLYQGWRMSRRKELSMATDKTIYTVGGAPIAVLKTPELEAPLFLSEPYPAVLLLDQQKAVEIKRLQTENEFRAFMAGIEDGLKKFKPDIRA